ncbi:hypothetical protein ARSEF4850_007748 [Beauveria asiatica]
MRHADAIDLPIDHGRPSNNNNSAGRQQRAAQQPTVTPLQLYMRHDSRPNESLLLLSSIYPGATSSYDFNDPSPSNSTGTIFIPDDDDNSPGLLEVESPDEDVSANNKIRRPRKLKLAAQEEKQMPAAARGQASEELISSNILPCQSERTARLRDALATCLTLVRETGNGSTEPEPAAGGGPSSQASMALVPSIPPAVPDKPASIKNIFGNKPYPDTNTSMAVSAFMDMLATLVVYYGYLALADPTLSTTRLNRHFGLPLQLMSRDKLLSYSSAQFQARICHAPGVDCPDKPGMPFFSIGGAGTHYSPALASSSSSAPLSLLWANTPLDSLLEVMPMDATGN